MHLSHWISDAVRHDRQDNLSYPAVAFNLEIQFAVLDQQFPMTCAKGHMMQTSRPFSSGVLSICGFCEIITQNSSQQHGLMSLESKSADLPSGPRYSLSATGPVLSRHVNISSSSSCTAFFRRFTSWPLQGIAFVLAHRYDIGLAARLSTYPSRQPSKDRTDLLLWGKIRIRSRSNSPRVSEADDFIILYDVMTPALLRGRRPH